MARLPDRHGRIAQLVEQLTLNQRVLGSSPSASTTFSALSSPLPPAQNPKVAGEVARDMGQAETFWGRVRVTSPQPQPQPRWPGRSLLRNNPNRRASSGTVYFIIYL